MAFNPMKHRIPFLKRAIPSLRRRLARRRWPGGFAVRRSRGAAFLLNYRNYVDRQIAFYDDFETEQLDYLTGALAESGCDLFLDVGANIGYYSVLVALTGRAGRVVAFEPDPRNAQQLRANAFINGVAERIELVPKAVSATSGEVGFLAYPDTSTGQSRVGEGRDARAVAAVALDDFVTGRDLSVFIKMDIEGHELDALRGAGRLLRENRVFLQVECFAANLPALTQAMAEAGLSHRRRIDDDHYFANF